MVKLCYVMLCHGVLLMMNIWVPNPVCAPNKTTPSCCFSMPLWPLQRENLGSLANGKTFRYLGMFSRGFFWVQYTAMPGHFLLEQRCHSLLTAHMAHDFYTSCSPKEIETIGSTKNCRTIGKLLQDHLGKLQTQFA